MRRSTGPPAVHVGPPGQRWEWLVEAVVAGGGRVVEPDDAEAVVWTSPTEVDGLARLLADHPGIRWVQLPFAGIEPYVPLLTTTTPGPVARACTRPPSPSWP